MARSIHSSPSQSSSPPLVPSPPSTPSLPLAEITEFDVWFEESPDNIPEPFPTPQDIINCQESITNLGGRKTKRISSSYVAKYGLSVTTIEAENLRFVHQKNVMRVPRVYAVYRTQLPSPHGEHYIGYIVMENIEGDTLESVWNSITAPEKLAIATRLKSSFDCLRSLKNPSGLIESIGGQGLQDDIFQSMEYRRELCGPFVSEDQMISALTAIYRLQCGERMAHKADFYDSVLPGILASQEQPVFTHNDLQRKNIIITPQGDIAVVDWAASGWYPPYWEYATTLFACGGWNDDWFHYASKALEAYPYQYIWLNTLRLDMWT